MTQALTDAAHCLERVFTTHSNSPCKSEVCTRNISAKEIRNTTQNIPANITLLPYIAVCIVPLHPYPAMVTIAACNCCSNEVSKVSFYRMTKPHTALVSLLVVGPTVDNDSAECWLNHQGMLKKRAAGESSPSPAFQFVGQVAEVPFLKCSTLQ